MFEFTWVCCILVHFVRRKLASPGDGQNNDSGVFRIATFFCAAWMCPTLILMITDQRGIRPDMWKSELAEQFFWYSETCLDTFVPYAEIACHTYLKGKLVRRCKLRYMSGTKLSYLPGFFFIIIVSSVIVRLIFVF